MRYAGEVNLAAINLGFKNARPGITLAEIDAIIEDHIRSADCLPAFKGYKPTGYPTSFPATACMSVNDVVVHGIPGDYSLKEGDLLTIDVGTKYNGFFVDSARTRLVLSHAQDAHLCIDQLNLIDATEAILQAQIDVLKNNCSLLELALAAEVEAKKWTGVSIMPQWGGHGIGKNIHMEPFIPSCIDRTKSLINQKIQQKRYLEQTLTTGQTICLEPVTTLGNIDIILDSDQWTVRQAEGKLAAHSERCLLITKNGYELLS